MALITLIAASAGADLLFYDGFDYTAGQLLAPLNDTVATPNPGQLNVASGYNWRYNGAGGAANQAPGIASGGLTYPGPLPSSGNSVLFDPTQLGASRVQVTPTAINSGTVYWSGLLQVGTVANLNAVNGMFLGGFANSTGPSAAPPTAGGGLLRIRQDSSDTTTYNIGTAMNTGTQAGNIQWTPTGMGFSAGQTVFIVASYDYVEGTANDVARMWVNPSLSDFGAATAPAATLTSNPQLGTEFGSVLSFQLRNVNTVGAPTGVLFDELRIGTSWADVTPVVIPEPAAAGLLGLGALVLLGWRRSRRS